MRILVGGSPPVREGIYLRLFNPPLSRRNYLSLPLPTCGFLRQGTLSQHPVHKPPQVGLFWVRTQDPINYLYGDNHNFSDLSWKNGQRWKKSEHNEHSKWSRYVYSKFRSPSSSGWLIPSNSSLLPSDTLETSRRTISPVCKTEVFILFLSPPFPFQYPPPLHPSHH